MSITTTVTDDEVNDVIDKCSEISNEVGTIYPGMSYEDGVAAALNWVLDEAEIPVE